MRWWVWWVWWVSTPYYARDVREPSSPHAAHTSACVLTLSSGRPRHSHQNPPNPPGFRLPSAAIPEVVPSRRPWGSGSAPQRRERAGPLADHRASRNVYGRVVCRAAAKRKHIVSVWEASILLIAPSGPILTSLMARMEKSPPRGRGSPRVGGCFP